VTSSSGVAIPSKEVVQQILSGRDAAREGMPPEVTRQARRLYVGNLPPASQGLTERQLLDFFTLACAAVGITTPLPVLSVWLAPEGTYCFIELRGVADAAHAVVALNGLVLFGRQLRVLRPAEYQKPPDSVRSYLVPLPAGFVVPPPPANPFAGESNIDQLRTLRDIAPPPPPLGSQAGALPSTATVLGVPVPGALTRAPPQQPLAPGDPAAAAAAAAAAATAARVAATLGLAPSAGASATLPLPPLAPPGAGGPVFGPFGVPHPALTPSRVLLIGNALTAAELSDDDEYRAICEDVRAECAKFGHVEELVIPRPHADPSAPPAAGVGLIFVRYPNMRDVAFAVGALNSRTFNGRRVVACYYDETRFAAKRLPRPDRIHAALPPPLPPPPPHLSGLAAPAPPAPPPPPPP
jgi:splicing factor U2AF subunit